MVYGDRSLEIKARTELDDAGGKGITQPAKARAVHVEDATALANVPLRIVENVEGLGANLQGLVFADPDVAEESGVPVKVQRAVDEVHRQVARRARRIQEEDLTREIGLPNLAGATDCQRVEADARRQRLREIIEDVGTSHAGRGPQHFRINEKDPIGRSENPDELLDLIRGQARRGWLQSRP